jgi:outer membrane receptor for ferrienterochelin and colicins
LRVPYPARYALAAWLLASPATSHPGEDAAAGAAVPAAVPGDSAAPETPRVPATADSVAPSTASTAGAAAAPADSALELEEKAVQVPRPAESSRAPYKEEVITRAEIERSPANNILDLLDGKPGMLKKIDCSVCNTAQIRLLGLHGAYTQVLVDGIPAFSGLGLTYGIEQIPLANVERIEVLKGTGSVKHGNNAVAGTINVITRTPSPAPSLFLSARYGDRNEQDYDGSYSGRLGKMGVQFAFSRNSTPALNMDGDEVQDVAESDRNFFSGRVHFPLGSSTTAFYGFSAGSEDRLGGTESGSRRTIGEFQPESTYVDEFGRTVSLPLVYQEYVRTKRVSYEAGMRNNLGAHLVHQLRLNGVEHYQDSWYGYLSLEARQRILYAESDWTLHLDRHEILAGAEYKYDAFDDNRSVGTHEYHVPALFLQDIWSPGEDWKLFAGLRGDWHNVHGPLVSPRAGVQYHGVPGLTLRLTGGGGFRTFNLFSEDHAATTSDVYYMEPNEGLDAERSWSALFGAEWLGRIAGAEASLGFSAHHTRIVDYIQAHYLPLYTQDGRQRVRYENMEGTTVAQGLEATAGLELPFGLGLDAGMNLLDNSNEGGAVPGRLYATPDHTVSAGLEWQHASGFRLAADMSRVGSQRLRQVRLAGETALPERESDPYEIFNASAEQRAGDLTFAVSVRNIGDFYQAQREPILHARGYSVLTNSVWAPLKGRSIHFGVRFQAGPRSGL